MSSELLISCIMSLGDDGGKTKLKVVLIVYFRTKYLFFERVSAWEVWIHALFCECAVYYSRSQNLNTEWRALVERHSAR